MKKPSEKPEDDEYLDLDRATTLRDDDLVEFSAEGLLLFRQGHLYSIKESVLTGDTPHPDVTLDYIGEADPKSIRSFKPYREFRKSLA